MGRARFFFTLPDEANVRPKWDPGVTQSIEGGQLRHDRSLIVRGRTGKYPIFPGDLTNHWRKRRISFPFRWSHGLAVIVRIEDDCVLRIGSLDFAEHDWIRTLQCEKPRFDSALPQHQDEQVGVAPNVFAIAGHIGYRQEICELFENLGLVLLTPLAGG